MIEMCEAKRFIEAMPWPEKTRPLLKLHDISKPGSEFPSFRIHVYRPENRYPQVVTGVAPSVEGALQLALGLWVNHYKLPPTLLTHITALAN